MGVKYNQWRAMLAITKASLLASFRSPQSVFFGLFFPIVLIVIFGSLGRGGATAVEVAFDKNVDTTNLLYLRMKSTSVLHFIDPAIKDIEDELRKGRITAIISVKKSSGTGAQNIIHLRTSSASQKDLPILESIVKDLIYDLDQGLYDRQNTIAAVSKSVVPGRQYKMIDFFLPGMIGFSLIGSAIFGVSFLFFSLRENLVLKRLYSTPIKRVFIILGEGLSKVIFQLMTVVVLILFGYFVYNFTLAHGLLTFIDMLILSCLALLVFLGFGFFVSGVARNQNVIPIYSNLFMFPQYFLSGTFFPKSALPESIHGFINILPLTAFNDALRNVAFEGAYLADCWPQILILVGWGIVVYFFTVKAFRWE